ncbi:MAG: hypothetical protein QXU60_04500 [Sulfolobales archaeon]
MKLREFKALSLAKLMSIAKQLREKYPDRRERVDHIVDTLATKLQQLRTFTLTDYLFTLYTVSREFPELAELIPSEETVKSLLKEGE